MPPILPKKPARWLVLLLGLGAFAAAYLHVGGLLIDQTNNSVGDILGADQKHNLKTAILTRGDRAPDPSKDFAAKLFDFAPHRTDGVINPLWPWIASWIVGESHGISTPSEVTGEDRALFDRGRRLSLGITLGFLCLLGIVLTAAGFTLPSTFNIILLGGLGALLPRCAYFQPEPVYYILFLLSWVCAAALIFKKRLPLYFIFGCLLGLAYLAKSSIQPLFAAFFAVTAYQFVRDLLTKHPNLSHRALVHVAGLALVALGFTLFAGPRLAHARSQYGSHFHSYPGYWMWMDDFDSAFQWMGDHPDARSLAAIPPGEKPSFANYWRNHSGAFMWHRLTDGFWEKTSEFFASDTARRDKIPRRPWESVLEHRGILFLFALLLLAATAMAARRKPPTGDSDKKCPWCETGPFVIFALGTFALSALAYGWYTPIGRGERFMLSLYFPLIFTVIAAADLIFRKRILPVKERWLTISYYTAQLSLTAFVAWRIIEILTWPHFAP